MYRRIKYAIALRPLIGVVVAGALGYGTCGAAQSSAASHKPTPDAQVEANVLKALAGASDLSNQPITTTTVYGVVTLSGTVQTEALRSEAETLASRAGGVQKVVDEMTLPGEASQAASGQSGGGELQSDGTVAPAAAQNDSQGQQAMAEGSPNSDNTQPAEAAPNQASGPGNPNYGPGAPEYRQPYGRPQNGYPGQAGYPQQGYPQQPGYPQQAGNEQQPGYPQQQPGYSARQGYNGASQGYGGQQGGETVTVPSGAMIRMRINQALDSSRTQPGSRFDGIVVNDVVAGGSVAIPRGATVHGTVVDATKSGALKGRGELALQLTEVTLAGRSYPLTTNVWDHHAGDKTTETVNRTVVGGGIGALIGAAAGGGAGAAIGAGVGGALGLGSSAASGDGQMYVPSEGLLTFQLAQPATVATVSQQEMDRLAQGVPPGAQGGPMRRRMYPYPGYGPVYYPYPYRRYPYPY